MIINQFTKDGTPLSKVTKGSEKLIEVQCENCNKSRWILYHNYYLSQEKKDFNKVTYCKPCSNKIVTGPKVSKALKDRKVGPQLNKRRENNPSWKGGTFTSADGYKMILKEQDPSEVIDKKTPGWARYRKEHLVIMEKSLGRALESYEVVHHIDGNKFNNSLDNLTLVETGGKHTALHHQLMGLGYELVKHRLINFDRQTNKYVAHEKLRELLEHLEADNQQPSLEGNLLEGSETKSEPKL